MEVAIPYRVVRKYTQTLEGAPEKVFALLCPVRETEWVPGWNPLIVYTNSGYAETECIFVTGDSKAESLWVMTDYDKARLCLEIIKVTPWTTVAKINIRLRGNDKGETDAEIVYSYTALDEAGKQFVDDYSEDYFEQFMQFWQASLNKYLTVGSKE